MQCMVGVGMHALGGASLYLMASTDGSAWHPYHHAWGWTKALIRRCR